MVEVKAANNNVLTALIASLKAKAKFDKVDQNRDGEVTLKEFNAHFGNDKVTISQTDWKKEVPDGKLSQKDVYQLIAKGDAAPASGEKKAFPSKVSAADILDKYLNMARVPSSALPRTKTETKIDEAISENDDTPGVITKEEFEEIFNVEMTDEAWKGFTGLKSAKEGIDLKTLSKRMDTMTAFIAGTRQTWFYFVACDQLTYIPSGKVLLSVFKELSDAEKTEFVKKHWHLLNPGEVMSKKAIDEMVDRLVEMENLKADQLEILMQSVFYSLYMEMKKAGKVLDLSDPLIGERFARTAFKDYLITRKPPSKGDIKKYNSQAKIVGEVRRLFGKKEEVDKVLGYIDAGSKDFDKVLDDISKILGDSKYSDAKKKAEIIKLLTMPFPIKSA